MTRTAVTPPASPRNADRGRAAPGRAAPGRYDRLREARVPADGIGRVPAAQRGNLVLGAVADPYEDGKVRLQVAIDRRVDILEEERAHKRISEAAYLTGRQIQALLEQLGHVGTVSWDGGSRGDPVMARELKHRRSIETARRVQAIEARVVGRIGMIGWRLIRRIVGDRMSFADCAALQGKSGERAVAYVGSRFREDLDDLAEALAARGKGTPTPDDAYRAAAPEAPARQVAAMRGGTTRRRLEGELESALATLAVPKALTARERGRLQEEAGAIAVRLVPFDRLDEDAAEVGDDDA